jgi:peptide chain release factor subunit 1
MKSYCYTVKQKPPQIQDWDYSRDHIFDENGKSKELCIDIIPPLPIKRELYSCDKRFHVETLLPLYETYENIGVVIVSGDYSLFYMYSENECREVDSISIYRKNKNRRGGQSSGRFFRIRLEQIHQYVIQLTHMLIRNYISSTTQLPIIKRLIIGGNGDVPTTLINSPSFPDKFRSITQHVRTNEIDINGQAIQQAIIAISRLMLLSTEEEKVLNKFNQLITNNSKKVTYGYDSTMYCLHNGLIQHLIVEDTEAMRERLKTLSEWIELYKPYVLMIKHGLFDTYKIGGILWFEFDDTLDYATN